MRAKQKQEKLHLVWQKPRENSLIRTGIDKFLISRNLSSKVEKTAIQPYPHSDHDLISLSLDLTQQQRGPGLWHFNNSLLNDPVFAEDIRSFWESWLAQKPNFDNPLLWWDKAKRHFKQIAIRRATTLRKIERHERSQLERNLQSFQQKAINGNPSDIEIYLTTKEKLKQFELKELEVVKIRAKARFTEEGEKSTRYFYSLEKRQQANHTIKTLTKDNMDTISDTSDIISETYHFYKSLYAAEATDFLDFLVPIPYRHYQKKIVTPAMLLYLNTSFTKHSCQWKTINRPASMAYLPIFINSSGPFLAQNLLRFTIMLFSTEPYLSRNAEE